jgi:hypothetical protein
MIFFLFVGYPRKSLLRDDFRTGFGCNHSALILVLAALPVFFN